VRPGPAANTLEARAAGERLTLLANGEVVAEATDAALGAGGVGVFAGGDGNDVLLEHFSVRGPD
jgi:hypothetical protein